MNDIGALIKTCRQFRKMSQHKLAELSEVSNTTVCNIETGKSDPRLSTVKQLLDTLEFDLELTIRRRQ